MLAPSPFDIFCTPNGPYLPRRRGFMQMTKRRIGVFLIAWLMVGAVLYAYDGESTGMELTTGAKVDLKRYMGAWHVIANIPYFAEKGKVATRDVYTLDANGNVDTTYFYRKSFDSAEKTIGSLGLVQPNSENAFWRVRFLGLFRADYLILDVAPDYSWALVGQRGRKLGWVLARDPMMDDATYATLIGKFHSFGYDPAKFLRVAQFPDQVGVAGFQ
jgi:apolipoprotein D and lipocalin family protein